MWPLSRRSIGVRCLDAARIAPSLKPDNETKSPIVLSAFDSILAINESMSGDPIGAFVNFVSSKNVVPSIVIAPSICLPSAL